MADFRHSHYRYFCPECYGNPNNAADFRRLHAREDVHAGLLIIVPQVRPIVQQAVLDMLADGRDPINEVFEVSIDDNDIVVDRYALPG